MFTGAKYILSSHLGRGLNLLSFAGFLCVLLFLQVYSCSDWVCTAVISNDVMKDLRGGYAI